MDPKEFSPRSRNISNVCTPLDCLLYRKPIPRPRDERNGFVASVIAHIELVTLHLSGSGRIIASSLLQKNPIGPKQIDDGKEKTSPLSNSGREQMQGSSYVVDNWRLEKVLTNCIVLLPQTKGYTEQIVSIEKKNSSRMWTLWWIRPETQVQR